MKRPAPIRCSLVAVLVVLAVLSFALVGCGDDAKQGKADQPKKSEESKPAAQAKPQAPPPELEVIKAKPVAAPLLKEYSASIEAKESVDIRARVAGYLQERLFTEGSVVEKGAPLFKIEPSEYQEALNQAQSQLTRDKATLDKARSDVQRYGELYKSGAISREEYDTRETTFKEYKATVEQDEAAVKQAQLNLSYTNITAPVSGRIGRAQAQVGDLVGQGENTLLATITTVDPVYVNFSISEQDYLNHVKQVHERQEQHKAAPKVELLLKLSDGSLYPHHGKVNMVDPTVDAKTGTLGVRATFPNPEGMLRPGQFARIMLAVERDGNVILVPQRAVTDVQGMKMCLTVNSDNKVATNTVTLGQQMASFVVVEKGLEAGDLVLVEGLQKVKAGDVVTPKITEMDLAPLLKEFGIDDAKAKQAPAEDAAKANDKGADAADSKTDTGASGAKQ